MERESTYRLLPEGDGFVIDVVPTTRKTRRVLARVMTRETAMAVLRLHGVREFQDWDVWNAHWGTLMTTMPHYE